MEEVDESVLVRHAQQGDDQAFGRLIQLNVDGAYRLALRILGSSAEAEDVVQDALYRAWRALAQFRGEAKFSTWLYRIVWRVASDRARIPAHLPLDVETYAGSVDDPAVFTERSEQKEATLQAIRQLPAMQRAVIALFYLEDLPLKEVAAILDLPVGTVKTHLHRARHGLKKQLERPSRSQGVEEG